MLDINLEFSPNLLVKKTSKIDELVITSCKIHQFSDGRLWSGFDDESYHYFNSNNNLGVLDFEIGFTGYIGTPYPKVYTKCFMLLTDEKTIIKPMKRVNSTSLSKVNNKGELIISIRYWFQDKNQIEKITSCQQILIESFFCITITKKYIFFCCSNEKR